MISLMNNKEFKVKTFNGYIEEIDIKKEYNELENREIARLSNVTVNGKSEIAKITINGKFYAEIGDSVLVTYIENSMKNRKYVSIANLDSWKFSYMEDSDSIVEFFHKKNFTRKMSLISILGTSLLIFILGHFNFSTQLLSQINNNFNYIISFFIFVLLYFLVGLELKQEKKYYSNLIKNKIKSVHENVRCPILFKKMVC